MSEGIVDPLIFRILAQNGIINKRLYLRTSPDIFSDFSDALNNAIQENEYGPFVSPQSATDLRDANATVFLSRDKMAGVSVWPDGNIGALFHHKDSRIRPARPELLLTALSYGGCKLDCFNGVLAIFYGSAGFIPVARVLFDYQYAPVDWKAEWGTPDIIFWCHNGNSPLTVARNYGKYAPISNHMLDTLPVFPTYEDAYKYRDSLIAANEADPRLLPQGQ